MAATEARTKQLDVTIDQAKSAKAVLQGMSKRLKKGPLYSCTFFVFMTVFRLSGYNNFECLNSNHSV